MYSYSQYGRIREAIQTHRIEYQITTFVNPNPPPYACRGCDWTGGEAWQADDHLASEIDKAIQ